MPQAGFDTAWEHASAVPGWCTREQAHALWKAASKLGPGSSVLEIGSHKGRSTMVLGEAMRTAGGKVYAVDPFIEGRLFGGQSTRVTFEENIAGADLSDVVELCSDYSTKLRPHWHEPIDLLYVDGKHDYWTCADDFRWGVHLPENGEMLVHDAYSSVGVTLSILVNVFGSRDWVYVERTGSLALFRRARPTTADRLRVLAEMPWWIRNVMVKVLLRLRLKPLTRLLGHSGSVDPY
ncbi:MAG: hypothetical protein JWO22_1778 [Frankiales bacterium]|nr:hypothetical protein [Frankiales bacterium]